MTEDSSITELSPVMPENQSRSESFGGKDIIDKYSDQGSRNLTVKFARSQRVISAEERLKRSVFGDDYNSLQPAIMRTKNLLQVSRKRNTLKQKTNNESLDSSVQSHNPVGRTCTIELEEDEETSDSEMDESSNLEGWLF